MLKKILIVVLILIGAFLGFVSTRPSTYRVERSATMAAPAATVYAIVNDFHRWGEWSPWDKLDPAMKKTFEGAEVGVGSIYTWSGNDKVGEGRMTLTESEPNSRVAMKLEFLKPWESTCSTELRFQEGADGTQVTWSIDGTNNFMSKAMSVFMNMDEMIGKDFVEGLANLKRVSESAPPPALDAPPAATDSAAAPAATT